MAKRKAPTITELKFDQKVEELQAYAAQAVSPFGDRSPRPSRSAVPGRSGTSSSSAKPTSRITSRSPPPTFTGKWWRWPRCGRTSPRERR